MTDQLLYCFQQEGLELVPRLRCIPEYLGFGHVESPLVADRLWFWAEHFPYLFPLILQGRDVNDLHTFFDFGDIHGIEGL